MYINDVNKKEEIRNIATQHLRKFGIKFRPKKQNGTNKTTNYGKKFFKVPLQSLETETITLKNGQQLVLPKRLHEICSFIISKACTEGIFRKEGSKSRQNEIKLSLDRGCLLGDEHHVIDVAVVLKVFLRELPEPLIPSSYHELFLRCSLIERKVDAIHLACLLLPMEHLNVLTYLMQFFKEVACFCEYNKMTFGNLAIVVGPNIFPIDEKLHPKSQLMLTKTCDIIKIMMENGDTLGFIPDYIIDEIGNSSSETDADKKRKKRRSGSLTRMFSGLKKIVSNKTEEENNVNIVTPDLLLTPCISRSIKKRKAETSGISLKKKKELLNKLPEGSLLNTPFTPSRTPISVNPNGKKPNIDPEPSSQPIDIQKEKKLHWYMRSRSMKSLKDESEKESRSRRSSFGPRAMLERRWSAVSQAANFKKKKINPPVISSAAPFAKSDSCTAIASVTPERDYVRVSKAEYEEIKNRVSAIERRISLELDTVQSHISEDRQHVDVEMEEDVVEVQSNIENVQNAYKHTLEQSENLSPTTDQLARRLSKELRIRRSTEPKIIRSPSARKIGNLRRRSRENDKRNEKLNRHQSWHIGSTPMNSQNHIPVIPRVTLQRKTSAPITSNKKSPRKPLTEIAQEDINIRIPYNLRKSPRMRNSFDENSHNLFYSSDSKLTCNVSGSSNEHWTSAEGFFSSEKIMEKCASSDRASIAKIRNQNAGMVLAKARLFDSVNDSDNSVSGSVQKKVLKTRPAHKSGLNRNGETRNSRRVRTLKNDERRIKKSMSPRQRMLPNAKIRQYAKENKMNVLKTPLRDSRLDLSPKTTPRHNVPQIKKPLMVKSPKRLCRTPVADRMTPMKVVATPMFNV